VAQVVEHLPSKLEALSKNASNVKKTKQNKKKQDIFKGRRLENMTVILTP
jgi:hypothetical protein